MEKQVQDLLLQSKEIEKNFFQLIDNTKDNYSKCSINSKDYNLQREIYRSYRVFVEVGARILYEIMNDEDYESFTSSQTNVVDAINLNENKDYDFQSYNFIKNQFVRSLDVQLALLESVSPLIKLNEENFRKELVLDFLDNEMEQVKLLLKNDYIRPSGVILGIILERYLKNICSENDINFKEKDTLQPLINKIYESNKIDWFNNRKKNELEHMASIRNSCSHDSKDEPKKEEVQELLLKVELYLSKEDF